MKKKGAFLAVFLVLVLTMSVGMFSVKANLPVGEAIDKGLAWLAEQQNPDGSWGTSYQVAKTGFAVIKFATHKHQTEDPTYDLNVEKGLAYLYEKAYTVDIFPQPAGDPDTNGNGIGIYFSTGRETYETGIVMMALEAASQCGFIDPDDTVPSGPLAGKTFREVMTDMVDYYAFAQNEAGTARGGWRYLPNYGTSDNSVSQWPVLGFLSAAAWGIYAPGWVKSELLEYWLVYSQHTDGCFGYTGPGSYTAGGPFGVTAAGLIELTYCGVTTDDPRWAAAAECICMNWGSRNIGNFYAMYGLMKAAMLAQPEEVWDFCGHMWQEEYDAWLLVTQNADGSWSADGYYADEILATEWALLILQKVAPPAPTPTPTPPPVGGVVIPVDKLELLAPWIALAAVIALVAVAFARRRKYGQ